MSMVSDSSLMSAVTYPDNSYGDKKRIQFLHQEILAKQAQAVLDMGCGTGRAVSRPLALLCPKVKFCCVEDDARTMEYAAKSNRDLLNCRFLPCIPEKEMFDLIIASEVLEHVQDPVRFLTMLRAHLRPNGKLLLTIPNGYGLSEWATALEYSLRLGKRLLRQPVSPGMAQLQDKDTLAHSPHIQFFTYSDLLTLLRACGFSFERYQGRMVACGFLLTPWIEAFPSLARWNLEFANRSPPWMVSDWMLVCGATTPAKERFTPPWNHSWKNAYVRAKRYLNTRKRLASERSELPRCLPRPQATAPSPTLPRTLVLAPFVFNYESGSGVTLSNLFQEYPPELLANLHSSPQTPDTSVCKNFFRLSRSEIHRPLFLPGPKFSSLGTNPTDASQTLFAKLRRWMAGNSGIPQHFRFSPQLRAWLDSFQPEVIYTILGPIPHLEALFQIQERYGAKIVAHCMDDWHAQAYTTGIFSHQRFYLRKLLRNALATADECLAIGPEMAKEFAHRYGRPFQPFQNAINLPRFEEELRPFRVNSSQRTGMPTLLYYGSVLPFAQTDSLLFTAHALEGGAWRLVIRTSRECASQLHSVVGGLKNTELQTYAGDPTDFPKHLASASALLLPANFDSASREFLRYSMPTKAPGYMASGIPILYFGPPDIAQGQYAAREGWALCVMDKNEQQVRTALDRLAHDTPLRAELVAKGALCVQRSHDQKIVRANFHGLLAKMKKSATHSTAWPRLTSGENANE